MQVLVLWIGKTRLPGVAALTEEYSGRIGHYCAFQGVAIRAARAGRGGASAEDALRARSKGACRVVLDASGERWDSSRFAQFLERARESGPRDIAFCVGGAEGFSRTFREEADLLLSLSSLTLPHELARVVLLEQLYRGFTMLANHPYPR